MLWKCKIHGLVEHKVYNKKRVCPTCSGERIAEQRRKNKIRLALHFGGKCINCGYSRCINSLTFHHRDPKKKKFGICNGDIKSYEKLLEEAEKCDLLCHNCHAEEHARVEDFEWKKTNVDFRCKPIKLCAECKLKNVKETRSKFCSKECYNKNQRQIDWPINLDKLVKESSMLAISKKLGVSGKAVKNRLIRDYGWR